MPFIQHSATQAVRRFFFTLGMAIGVAALFPLHANASVTCSAYADDITFYDVVPWQSSGSLTGNITVQCRSGLLDFSTQLVNVCLGIGTGVNSSSWDPRRLFLTGSTSTYMDFQLSKMDGNFFGSPFQLYPEQITNLAVPGFAGSSSPQTVTMRALLPAQSSTLPPGRYVADFPGGHTLMAVSAPVATWWGTPSDCSTSKASAGTFPFTITANVPAYCSITSTSTMAFPPVAGFGDSQRDATAIIGVRCTATTAYKINLTPSNNNANGQGTLRLVANGTDSIRYTLYQDSARTTPWGNLTSNNYSGIGTGQEQQVTVYGRVPANLDATPGEYRDSVQVTVTY